MSVTDSADEDSDYKLYDTLSTIKVDKRGMPDDNGLDRYITVLENILGNRWSCVVQKKFKRTRSAASTAEEECGAEFSVQEGATKLNEKELMDHERKERRRALKQFRKHLFENHKRGLRIYCSPCGKYIPQEDAPQHIHFWLHARAEQKCRRCDKRFHSVALRRSHEVEWHTAPKENQGETEISNRGTEVNLFGLTKMSVRRLRQGGDPMFPGINMDEIGPALQMALKESGLQDKVLLVSWEETKRILEGRTQPSDAKMRYDKPWICFPVAKPNHIGFVMVHASESVAFEYDPSPFANPTGIQAAAKLVSNAWPTSKGWYLAPLRAPLQGWMATDCCWWGIFVVIQVFKRFTKPGFRKADMKKFHLNRDLPEFEPYKDKDGQFDPAQYVSNVFFKPSLDAQGFTEDDKKLVPSPEDSAETLFDSNKDEPESDDKSQKSPSSNIFEVDEEEPKSTKTVLQTIQEETEKYCNQIRALTQSENKSEENPDPHTPAKSQKAASSDGHQEKQKKHNTQAAPEPKSTCSTSSISPSSQRSREEAGHSFVQPRSVSSSDPSETRKEKGREGAGHSKSSTTDSSTSKSKSPSSGDTESDSVELIHELDDTITVEDILEPEAPTAPYQFGVDVQMDKYRKDHQKQVEAACRAVQTPLTDETQRPQLDLPENDRGDGLQLQPDPEDMETDSPESDEHEEETDE